MEQFQPNLVYYYLLPEKKKKHCGGKIPLESLGAGVGSVTSKTNPKFWNAWRNFNKN